MSTTTSADTLAAALFGKTRRNVLALLYAHPDQAFYLREVMLRTGGGPGAVQRELKRLSEAGIILRSARGRQVYYQANRPCPIFTELHGLVIKTTGVADVLRNALARLADGIEVAFVFGSLAKGTGTGASDVDVMVVGEAAFAEVSAVLGPAQEKLGRDVNPSVYPPEEFQRKLAHGHHFLTTVLREPKVYLIGDEHELARLAQGRLADGAPHQPARDRGSPGRGRPRLGRLPDRGA
jgi:predicted nucleotidyltransferase